LAQDDYYYEIQLTNKQLVFYFMAGAAGLILSFLAGVMVGRGIDSGAVAAGNEPARPVVEEKVVTEQSPSPAATDYSYPQRLESERPADGLEKPGAAVATPAAGATPAQRPPIVPRVAPTPATRPAATPLPTPPPVAVATPEPVARPTPTPRPAPAAAGALPRPIGSGATIKGFAVQVGAFKDRASADSIVKGLKGRGLPAFTVPPVAHSGGLFTVRVGAYRDRGDAEAVLERLRDDKFKPYIIKQ
jgi:rare lipoprotein A